MKLSLAEIYAPLTPDKHITGYYAADEHGVPLLPTDAEAAKWCSVGWVRNKYRDLAVANTILARIENKLSIKYITLANDELGYAFIKGLQAMDEVFEVPS